MTDIAIWRPVHHPLIHIAHLLQSWRSLLCPWDLSHNVSVWNLLYLKFFAYDLKDVAFADFIWKLDEIQPDASLNFLSELASFLLQHGAAHLPDQEHHQHLHHHHNIDEEHHIMNLRLLTPKSFAESRQAALRAGYSPGVKHSNDFKLPRILPSKIKHDHFL